jgi:hypothetical protein
VLDVREYWILDLQQLGDVTPDGGILHADGQYLSIDFLKPRIVFLQLPELRPAGASTAGSVEQQNNVLLASIVR